MDITCLHQFFLPFYLGTHNWYEHVAWQSWGWLLDSRLGASRGGLGRAYCTLHLGSSAKKWLPSNHFHLVVFSQWSRTHNELAKSTIFFLTSSTDLHLEVKGKIPVCSKSPAKELWKRPEVPRDGQAFGSNRTGRTSSKEVGGRRPQAAGGGLFNLQPILGGDPHLQETLR